MTSTVYISSVRTAWWRKVAPDQRLEHLMTPESDQTAIVRMSFILFLVVRCKSVVEACRVLFRINLVKPRASHDLTQNPQIHCLVFGIAEHISAVALAVDICDSFGMANEGTGFTAITH